MVEKNEDFRTMKQDNKASRMKATNAYIFTGLLAMVVVFGVGPAHAQYTNNNQTNTVSGSSVTWNYNYYVGNTNYQDVLIVTNASRVISLAVYAGYAAGANNNSILLTGSQTVWNSDDFYVGSSGASNSLLIARGGQLTSMMTTIGSASGGNCIQVTDGGSSLNSKGAFFVGAGGNGNQLVITNGAVVSAPNVYLGSSCSSNFVLVTSAGSTFNSGQLDLGLVGHYNTLSISTGGLVNASSVMVGFSGNGNQVIVNGGTLKNSGDLYVGHGGTGNMLTITNGGSVFDVNGRIGEKTDNNSAFVSASVWSNSADFYLGEQANANTLTILNGGKLYNGYGYVGYGESSPPTYSMDGNDNSMVVGGSGSVWRCSSDLFLGYYGARNSLSITNGGQVNARSVTVGAFDPSSANVLAISGGSLVTTNPGAGALDVRRGTFTLNKGTVLANQFFATNGATSIVQFNAGLLGVGQATVVNGQAFEVGDGVQNAQLDLRGGTNNFASGLNIASNSSLTGSGSITNGSVLVRQGGTVAPGSGSAFGTLAISNNLTLAGGLVIKLNNLSGANGTGDFVNVTGLLDLTGGTFTIQAQSFLTNAVYVFGTYGTTLGTLSATNISQSLYILQTNYNGNELALVAIPEPVAIGGLLLLGGALFTARRLRTWRG